MNTLDVLSEAKLVDGAIVIEVPGAISAASAERLTQAAERAWPGRKIFILCDGAKISHADAQLDRIGHKLDEVLSKIAREPWFGGGPG